MKVEKPFPSIPKEVGTGTQRVEAGRPASPGPRATLAFFVGSSNLLQRDVDFQAVLEGRVKPCSNTTSDEQYDLSNPVKGSNHSLLHLSW